MLLIPAFIHAGRGTEWQLPNRRPLLPQGPLLVCGVRDQYRGVQLLRSQCVRPVARVAALAASHHQSLHPIRARVHPMRVHQNPSELQSQGALHQSQGALQQSCCGANGL
jgi:hypothetical protein